MVSKAASARKLLFVFDMSSLFASQDVNQPGWWQLSLNMRGGVGYFYIVQPVVYDQRGKVVVGMYDLPCSGYRHYLIS